MWEEINRIIAFLANWFEAIGFIIGLFVAVKVFFINKDVNIIKKRYLYHQRIDEHLNELKTSSTSLANQIPNFTANIRDIRLTAAKCRVNCLSLKKKVGKSELKQLNAVITQCTKIKNNKLVMGQDPNIFQAILGRKHISESQLDTFYEVVTSLISEIEHLNQDLKKSVR